MNTYPHMCRSDHPEIGHSTDEEMCPVCIEKAAREKAEAALAEWKIATKNQEEQCQAFRESKKQLQEESVAKDARIADLEKKEIELCHSLANAWESIIHSRRISIHDWEK